MKVKVVKPFCDKFNLTRMFNPGEVVDFEQARAENIVERGLGEYLKEAPKAAPKVEEVKETPSVFDAPEAEEKKKPGRKPRQKKEE